MVVHVLHVPEATFHAETPSGVVLVMSEGQLTLVIFVRARLKGHRVAPLTRLTPNRSVKFRGVLMQYMMIRQHRVLIASRVAHLARPSVDDVLWLARMGDVNTAVMTAHPRYSTHL